MNPRFWLANWQMGHTGFHLNEVNPVLLRHWEALGLKAAASVPVCQHGIGHSPREIR